MRNIAVLLAIGLLAGQNATQAQTNNLTDPSRLEASGSAERGTGVVGETAASNAPEYTPLTASERWRLFVMGAFGPGALARAVAIGGIAQATGTPKEWGGGAKAYGERIGNVFAEHVIRKTLESGAAAALHEDDRYFRSTETGFWKRSRHAVWSAFVARNAAGQEHLAYSRIGATAGASFISRIWEPRSVNSSGDAAVNFGITMAAHMGWNMVKEFRPRRAEK
jgi:hypothetical protein